MMNNISYFAKMAQIKTKQLFFLRIKSGGRNFIVSETCKLSEKKTLLLVPALQVHQLEYITLN